MTPHDHRTLVPGCYRCELGRDEAEAAERDEMVERAVDALMEDSGLPRFGAHRETVERRQRLALSAALHWQQPDQTEGDAA